MSQALDVFRLSQNFGGAYAGVRSFDKCRRRAWKQVWYRHLKHIKLFFFVLFYKLPDDSGLCSDISVDQKWEEIKAKEEMSQ